MAKLPSKKVVLAYLNGSVTKTDLLKALKEYENWHPREVHEAKEREEGADDDLRLFCETDERYKLLHEASRKARDERWGVERRHRDVHSAKMRRIRSALFTRGPTAAVVKMVEEFIAGCQE